jgi:type II restriction enzyme
MDLSVAEKYKSNSQKIRVITENWFNSNMYCPCCGNLNINHFENNRPVADFYCPLCYEEYELKSKSGKIENKITDGAYDTMIQRINTINNPNFFFMNYSKREMKIKDLMMVPKHFFVDEIIEKRPPLAETARRAGWVGCNIEIKKIPNEGKIYIVKDEMISEISDVLKQIEKTNFIAQYNLKARGWILDILHCVGAIDERVFSLEQVYRFEDALKVKHPQNKHIKEKIRQQLQVLRDKGLIEFLGNGHYRKVGSL